MMKRFFIIGLIFTASIMLGCQGGGGTRPTQHIAPDPQAAEINMRLGLSYLQRGDYKIALEKLDKSLQQDPSLPSAHNTIAILYQRLGVLDKAERHFKQAIRNDPRYSEAHNNFGVFLCQQGRHDEAEQHFLEAIKNPLYNNAAQAIENAGICVNQIPDSTLAEQYFRKALQMNPTLSKSLFYMAELSYLNTNYLQARGYLERYKAVSLWSSQSLYLAIKTENKLKDQNAVASYSLLLKGKFPDSDQAMQVRKGQY